MDSLAKSSRKEGEDIPIGPRLPSNTCSKVLVQEKANSTRDDGTRWIKNAQIQKLQAKGAGVARSKKKEAKGAMAAKEVEKGTISAQLRGQELWEMFYREETEMIITKAGRRMFPVPDFCFSGLEPDQYYGCAVEIVAVDSHRYRYKNSEGWVPAGKGLLVDQEHCRYLHPNSASLGQFWMAQGATFDKLKLSNHIIPNSENLVINSMQKYRLRLVLTRLGVRHCDRWVFNFPETHFITVTSYQNPRMTQLKIDNNPFAKAFREGKRSNRRSGTCKESKAKRRRTRFPSPPPIIRYQPPFINFLSSQEHPPVNSAPPPPPPPPLSHDWPEEPCLTRNIPVQNELLFPWERDDMIAPQIPSMSSSFKLELNGTFQWRDSYGFPPFEPPVEEFQPQFPAPCWSSALHPGYGLFEDVQMQHYTSRDQFWRES